MKKPILSVIIVTWNSASDIDVCLSSLKYALRSITHEVFVIDNTSKDDTVKIIRSRYPWVKLLPQTVNLGFGQGNNIGLAKAKGIYILLLNPDTKVNTHAIKTMISFLDTYPTVGAVGPEQLNGIGTYILMKSKTSLLGLGEYVLEKIVSRVKKKSIILFPYPHRVSILNAGCLMARSSILPTKQWFDPEFFLYGEEEYLFQHINAIGWKSYFLRNCSITHYREKSIGKTGNKWKYVLQSFSLLFTRAIKKWLYTHHLLNLRNDTFKK